jgi:phosphotransferase system HPr (HPr) family protein
MATVLVPNPIGLHARPAAMLARMAQEYDSEIVMEYGGHTVNAKSMLGIMTLGAGPGAQVRVSAEGCDAGEAVRAIEGLFASATWLGLGSPANASEILRP